MKTGAVKKDTAVAAPAPAALSPEETEIKNLENQKLKLEEQIKSINESKQDELTKKERIKTVKEQIDGIDAEIRRLQMEKIQKAQKAAMEESTKNKKEEPVRDILEINGVQVMPGSKPQQVSLTAFSAGMGALAAASSSQEIARTLDRMKKVGKHELKLFADYASKQLAKSGSVDEYTKEQLRRLKELQKKAEEQQYETMSKANDDVKKAEKMISEEKPDEVEDAASVEDAWLEEGTDSAGTLKTSAGTTEFIEPGVPRRRATKKHVDERI